MHAAAAEREPLILADPIIKLTDIQLRLPSQAGMVEILRGISLQVAAGEALGLTGPSGSGKSTLLMVMAGLEAPSAGTVEVAGTRLDALGEDALADFRRDNVGIVFQSFHLIPTMTALENVALPLELKGADDAFARAGAELGRVGLAPRLSHYPGQLSGGEQQRVALARALAAGARVLLADEPTGNLDEANSRQIVDLMFALKDDAGATLVLVSHDEALAQRCDRVVRLSDGRIAGEERLRAPREGRPVTAA